MIRKFVRRSTRGGQEGVALYVLAHVDLPTPGEGFSWQPLPFTEADAIMAGLIELLVTVRREGAALGPL